MEPLETLWDDVRELSLGTTTEITHLRSPPSALRFLRDFVSANKPCLISNAIQHWPALSNWSDNSYLLQSLSSTLVSLHLTPDGRADALAPYPTPSGSDDRCFASAHQQNDCFRSEYSALSADCDEDIAWATEAFGCLPEAVNLWIGNEFSETSFHKDHYENLYAVVSGEKHFVLLPPTDVHRMYIRNYPSAHYNYSKEDGKFVLELDEPARDVPWCSVNPYPSLEAKDREMFRFPMYFNGPQPFEVTVKAGQILYFFDLWQKDGFFSAAEEVQQSADIMESAYRLREKERSKGLARDDLDELCRELQTALGTAKWQLRAIKSLVVVTTLKPDTDNSSLLLKAKSLENHKSLVHDYQLNTSSPRKVLRERIDLEIQNSVAVVTSNQDIQVGESLKELKFVSEFEPHEALRARNFMSSQDDAVTGSKGSESSPENASGRITISDDVEQRKTSIVNDDASKEKRLKIRYWNILNAKASTLSIKNLRGVSRFKQLFGQVGVFRRQLSSPRHLDSGCSKQVKLALMLTLLIIVPFLLYST
ncbi:unnamed protein product [Rhodiola kirilowii]